MAQGTPQFSPAQVLEAGRRAEAEGKFDYAVQFYRHLVTHFASSAEAGAAREGLDRIERGGTAATATQSLPTTSPMPRSGQRASGSPPSATAGTTPFADGIPARPAPYLNGADPHHYGTAASSWPGPATPTPYAPAPHPALPPRGPETYHDPGGRSAAMAPVMLPSAEDGYRMGRWLSRIFSAVGWLMFFGGLVLLVATPYLDRLGIGLLNTLAAFGPTPLGVAAGIGLWLVFSGQRARAAFDVANSTQELVAIERAKLGAPMR